MPGEVRIFSLIYLVDWKNFVKNPSQILLLLCGDNRVRLWRLSPVLILVMFLPTRWEPSV
jgi:hypothetical protein